jgi:hypothetical protein
MPCLSVADPERAERSPTLYLSSFRPRFLYLPGVPFIPHCTITRVAYRSRHKRSLQRAHDLVFVRVQTAPMVLEPGLDQRKGKVAQSTPDLQASNLS